MLDWLNGNSATVVINTAFTIVLLLIFLFLLILHLLSKRDNEGVLGAPIDLTEEEEESDHDYGSWLDLTPEEPILDTDDTKDIPLDWSYTPIRRDASDWVKELDLTLGRRATTFRTAGSQRRTYTKYNPRSARPQGIIYARTEQVSEARNINLYVGVDTSASMNEYMQSRRAAQALDEIIRKDNYHTLVTCVDTVFKGWQSGSKVEEIFVSGGGGTYMTSFFEELDKIRCNPSEKLTTPDAAVLITDGELNDCDWENIIGHTQTFSRQEMPVFIIITNPKINPPEPLKNFAYVYHAE
jgi:hypothetical protein